MYACTGKKNGLHFISKAKDSICSPGCFASYSSVNGKKCIFCITMITWVIIQKIIHLFCISYLLDTASVEAVSWWQIATAWNNVWWNKTDQPASMFMVIGHLLDLEVLQDYAAPSGRSPVYCYMTTQLIRHLMSGTSWQCSGVLARLLGLEGCLTTKL